MKEIGSISLVNMNNAAHFLFVSNMADRAEKDSAVAEKCAEQVKALRAAVTAEDDNLQLSAKSLVTDKIAEAAKALAQHIKDYKISPQMQMDKETGLLMNFIQDLEGKFSEQIKTLSLGAFVEKLKASNESVRDLTAQRTDERSAKTAGALKTARGVSEEAYKTLVQHVNAHALLEGDEAYSAFIDYANTEIEHFKKEVLKSKK